ncbi:uncharacterized protein LOC123534959 [Mercenaria mercenaria]|uniref:uncharacterized protein LOC123534959 n=1 Tax=Mercenaria mercenaria TaxID=6596 RepID=UPI00234E405C|nr:uncharacterized protein LOC123534959 [Mercenaria mercenaria]
MTMKVFQILALLVVLAAKYGQAKVEPLECLPPDLQHNLDICHSAGDLRNQSGQIVFWTSINLYVSKFADCVSNMTMSEKKLFESTLYEIMRPVLEPSSRRKRQASDYRIRKEVRAMTDTERNRYFAAVNAMKNDRRLRPNVYDFLAGLHRGQNIGRAHGGPAFPSWHRLYLYIYESILRLWYDSDVTIPVWASVLDNAMPDPTQSVIFSPEFYGNGVGVVQTGPFMYWRFLPGQPIRRNIGGSTRRLMSYTAVERILTRRRNSEILTPLARPEFNLENEHGYPHEFVGGTMNVLNTAAFDPLFFSHHAYIDYLWERFRWQQVEQTPQINPETDYPFDVNDSRFRPSHHPNAYAGFASVDSVTVLNIQLGDLIHRVGYSNVFFNLVQYRATPECPNCDNSPFLYCEPNIGRCVSRSSGVRLLGDNTTQMASQALSETPEAIAFSAQAAQQTAADSEVITNSRVTSNPYHLTNNGDSCERKPFIHDVDTKQMGRSDDWAYIPVNVVSKRPPSFTGYREYSLYKTQTRWTHQATEYKYEFMQAGWQYEYEGCSKRQDVVGKISVVSWGLNYDGYAEEYVIVDNRYGLSQANGYLPVKKPSAYNPSEFITVAYDSCGRVCKPYCNNQNHGHINEHFGGGFRVSIDSPKQYSNSYEEAMLGMWDSNSPSFSPVIDYGDIPITFYCEYTNKWIWDKPPPQTPPPAFHYQTPTNDGPGVEVPKPLAPYGGSAEQCCVVASDCTLDGPCKECADFDYEYCRGRQKIAVCIDGKFSVTATTAAHLKHFYGKN